MRSFDVSFDLHRNKWVNNPDAVYLRRHRAHYDVAVMGSSPVQDKSTKFGPEVQHTLVKITIRFFVLLFLFLFSFRGGDLDIQGQI